MSKDTQEAVEIIRALIADIKRKDAQWGIKSYAQAVQFLKKLEAQ